MTGRSVVKSAPPRGKSQPSLPRAMPALPAGWWLLPAMIVAALGWLGAAILIARSLLAS